MVIRRKDGNIYVLDGPNPIVKDQEHWDPAGLLFHNFNWMEVTTQSENRPANKIRPFRNEVTNTTFAPETKEEPEEAKAEPEEVKEDGKSNLPYIKYKVLCHCLPATTKVHKDKLYGESWRRVSYGKKIIFPCIVINSSDTLFSFWTSDPDRQIEEGSIVYPFSYEVHNMSTDSYDRVPYDEYRWWKVSEREQKDGGWIMMCSPSQDQPDFSE